MKNLEKRAVYFFDRLALLISEDPEVRDVLHYSGTGTRPILC